MKACNFYYLLSGKGLKVTDAGGGEIFFENILTFLYYSYIWKYFDSSINVLTNVYYRWGGARDTGTIDMDSFREEVIYIFFN